MADVKLPDSSDSVEQPDGPSPTTDTGPVGTVAGDADSTINNKTGQTAIGENSGASGEASSKSKSRDADSQNVLADLDWTQVSQDPGEQLRPEVAGTYDSRPHEDKARRTIAYLLIWLLWALVVIVLGMLVFKRIEPKDIKEFSVLLGPIVTLVSAATGFYYGTKSK